MSSYDPQLALRQAIASILDHPSVFMGGPSQQNLRKADRIIECLRADSGLLEALRAEKGSAAMSSVDRAVDEKNRVTIESDGRGGFNLAMTRNGFRWLVCSTNEAFLRMLQGALNDFFSTAPETPAALSFTHWSKDAQVPYADCRCQTCLYARGDLQLTTTDSTAANR